MGLANCVRKHNNVELEWICDPLLLIKGASGTSANKFYGTTRFELGSLYSQCNGLHYEYGGTSTSVTLVNTFLFLRLNLSPLLSMVITREEIKLGEWVMTHDYSQLC